MVAALDDGIPYRLPVKANANLGKWMTPEEAEAGDGPILSASNRFFDADPNPIAAFTDAARRCNCD